MTGITRKLFLALLLISIVILVMSAIFGRLSFQRGFTAYIAAREAPIVEQLAADLAGEYSESGDWKNLQSNERLWQSYIRRAKPNSPNRESRRRRGPPSGMPPPRRELPPPPDKSAAPLRPGFLPSRIGLFDPTGQHIAGRTFAETSKASGGNSYSTTPVTVNDSEVAELRVASPTAPSSEIDIAFAQQQKQSLAGIAGMLLALAWLVSWLLARQFTKPIRDVANGTRALASGDYNQPVAIRSKDELGALAADVNTLAGVLEANRESRRRWLGDINHELRTPITVLNAELQALEDGYRPFNADSVASLQSEVERLAQLVDDLYSLSSSDEGQLDYRFAEFDICELLRERIGGVAARLEEEGLEITMQLPTGPLLVNADQTRIGQLFTNLIENSIRYTDSPGKIEISLNTKVAENKTFVQFAIQDTKPGVATEQHGRIFERLFRVDTSRNRRDGGSGLGLSICQAIVAAHHGKISAENSVLGGLKISVSLPTTE